MPFRDAIGTSTLRRLVEQVTDEVMAELAAEHRKGRRLAIGTTRLETWKAVVWDVGRSPARAGRARRLIVDVMIAPAAVPGVVPAGADHRRGGRRSGPSCTWTAG
ncbi:MAG: hypothetical protein U0871_05040 [Gemmataceae bacterium]